MKGVDTEICARESHKFVVSVDKDINIANAVACALALHHPGGYPFIAMGTITTDWCCKRSLYLVINSWAYSCTETRVRGVTLGCVSSDMRTDSPPSAQTNPALPYA